MKKVSLFLAVAAMFAITSCKQQPKPEATEETVVVTEEAPAATTEAPAATTEAPAATPETPTK